MVKSTSLLFFGDAAPSVPSFIGSKVILVEILCALCRPHFLTDFFQILYRSASSYSQIYTPIVFGDAAPCVPSFIGSKVIFWFTFLCAL